VTFDAVDPQGLPHLWAGLLGYRIEESHDLVAGLLAASFAREQQQLRRVPPTNHASTQNDAPETRPTEASA
jgi:hypothetical protein